MLASIPILPLTYRIGTQLGGRRVGLLGTLVIVSNGLWVFYAHQARMYPLASTLALLTLYLLLLTLDGPPRSRRVWLALTAAAVLTLYTVYYSFFALLGAAAYIAARLWTTERSLASFRRRLLPYLAVVGVTALSFLPWLPAVIGQLGAGVNPAWRAFVPASTLLARTLNALALGHTANARPDVWGWLPKAALGLVIVAGCLSLLAASHRRNSERRPVVASLTLIFVPLAAIYVISLWKPIYNDRYVVVLLPAFALLLAALLTSLWRRSTALSIVATSAVVAASLTSVINFYFDQRYAWDDYRSAVSYVREHLWPDDILLLTSANSYPIFDY